MIVTKKSVSLQNEHLKQKNMSIQELQKSADNERVLPINHKWHYCDYNEFTQVEGY